MKASSSRAPIVTPADISIPHVAQWLGDKAGRILRDLFVSFVDEPGQLPPHFREPVERDGVHRAVCDYIAGMTDRFALDEHEKLFDPRVRV